MLQIRCDVFKRHQNWCLQSWRMMTMVVLPKRQLSNPKDTICAPEWRCSDDALHLVVFFFQFYAINSNNIVSKLSTNPFLKKCLILKKISLKTRNADQGKECEGGRKKESCWVSFYVQSWLKFGKRRTYVPFGQWSRQHSHFILLPITLTHGQAAHE